MNTPAAVNDKVLVHEHYSVHLRPKRAAARWSSEARPTYTALFLLDGALRWTDAHASGELRAPAALLVAPGEPAGARGAKAAYLLVTLAPAYLLDCAVRARLTRADARITFPTRISAHDPRLNGLASDLADELNAPEAGQDLFVAALVEQITVQLLRRHAHIRRADELELSRVGLIDRRIRRAVELMHAQLDQNVSLEAMAAAAYLSPFHFARLFKKVTGMSPHAYLAALRLERAQTLLATTDLSISELSARVGYISPSHFAKAFRHATGLAPRAFRAALIGQDKS
ncbi:MAG TPA: AraC family transcriptional regulator [Pyrinomonadaceae bacterium]|nr:AraC family transcriptional regulator [Pyrinomonadaceae bacterium]